MTSDLRWGWRAPRTWQWQCSLHLHCLLFKFKQHYLGQHVTSLSHTSSGVSGQYMESHHLQSTLHFTKDAAAALACTLYRESFFDPGNVRSSLTKTPVSCWWPTWHLLLSKLTSLFLQPSHWSRISYHVEFFVLFIPAHILYPLLQPEAATSPPVLLAHIHCQGVAGNAEYNGISLLHFFFLYRLYRQSAGIVWIDLLDHMPRELWV